MEDNIMEACDEKIERLKEQVKLISEDRDSRISSGKKCYGCHKEIMNDCGNVNIYETACGSCNPGELTNYYCDGCFIKSLNPTFVKRMLKEDAQRQKEKKK